MKARIIVGMLTLGACNLDSKLPATDDAPLADVPVDEGSGPCDLSKPFEPPVVVAGIAAGAGLRLASNELDGYFDAILPGGMGNHDLYTASRTSVDGAFGTELALIELNSSADDSTPAISGDGLTVVFTSSRAGGNGSFNLYVATRSSTALPFQAPTRITALDDAGNQSDPFLREDGTVLYYADGGTITRATLGGGGFANAVPDPAINGTSDDDAPIVTPDELTIYWASNRSGGQGGKDIWTATRASTSDMFGTIRNVTELNSAGEEKPRFVSRDGCTLVFDKPGSGNPSFVATKPR